MKQTLLYKKSTKGTHVFASDDPDAAVPSLYVKKHAFKTTIPTKIRITIEVLK